MKLTIILIVLGIYLTNFCMDIDPSIDPTIKNIAWKDTLGKYEDKEVTYFAIKKKGYIERYCKRSIENSETYYGEAVVGNTGTLDANQICNMKMASSCAQTYFSKYEREYNSLP